MKRSLPILAATLGLLVAMATSPAPAAAQLPEEPPPLLTATPEDELKGSEAGRLSEAMGVAVDPLTHHFFVADWSTGTAESNNRISEFTAWGEFIKAFGWGVRDGADELQTCTVQTGCQKGVAGAQPGQLDRPGGLGFDAAGNLYAFEFLNSRVQKFDPTAGPGGEDVQFLDEWGGAGTADGQFLVEPKQGVLGSYLAVDRSDEVTPGDTVYVADKGRIQAFDTAGNFQFKCAMPQDLNPGALAHDPASGDLYLVFNQESGGSLRPTIYRLKVPGCEVVDEITPDVDPDLVSGPGDSTIAVALDAVGNLYAIDAPRQARARVQKYSPSGELLSEFDNLGSSEVVIQTGLAAAAVGPEPGEADIYVTRRSSSSPFEISSVRIYGATPDPAVVGPPPSVPPTIADQYATAVTETEATLRAKINPNFWDDTTYYVEYGPAQCKASDCADFPVAPGSRLTTKVTKATLTTQDVFLAGLEPATRYFYRFVADSSGGGPVYGIDPDGEGPEAASFQSGLEGFFTTRSHQPRPVACPTNEAFRPEPAKKLPDCRAYEMVSPIDKNGADISVVFNVTGFPAGFDQANPDGEELSYAAYRAFGDAVSAPYSVQYLASRSVSGWSSTSLAAPLEGSSFLEAYDTDAEYKALTPDLREGFLFRQTNPVLDLDAPSGYPNLYRRDNATGTYEALVTDTPPVSAKKFFPALQGYGGECAVFRAKAKLTLDAGNTTTDQLYKACKGQPLELVSVLPSGAAAAQASAGTGAGGDRDDWVSGAVSRDGQIVFWSDRVHEEGKLYARIGDSETVALSRTVAPPAKRVAQFWAAGEDGSKAIFTEGEGSGVNDSLFEFTLGENAEEVPTLIAGHANGVLGASKDASVLYFLSREVLDGEAEAGEPNLYRFDSTADTYRYIVTLAEEDAKPFRDGFYGPVKRWPIFHTSQVTPDGGAVAFSSVASLTGFDNKDANTGKPNSEVFVYRAGPNRLICVSCNPSGARPAGREVRSPGVGKLNPTAGELQAPYNSLYAPRVISNDGSRVFFNSYVPLVRGDTNGRADVYQWEALGKGTCKVDAPGYDTSYAGCVNLISGGESSEDSTFVDASADGRDVFFKTGASLLPQDPGLVDIYDAREGGGFPLQIAIGEDCEGEGCQSPAPAPPAPTPSSQSFRGPGNVKHCPRGRRLVKRAGKETCVKKRKSKNRRKGKGKGNRGKANKGADRRGRTGR